MNIYRKYPDHELLSLLAQDDEQAFTEIYNRYWQKLFVVAHNRVKEKTAAEDIVHDVFTSLWTSRHKRSIATLENYLAIAVKYSVLAKIKKLLKEQQLQQTGKTVSLVESPVDSFINQKEILDIVQAEVEKLPEKCRLIFTYSRHAGMPVKEIAQQLHLSPKTVEHQLTKAFRQLRLALRSFLHTFMIFW